MKRSDLQNIEEPKANGAVRKLDSLDELNSKGAVTSGSGLVEGDKVVFLDEYTTEDVRAVEITAGSAAEDIRVLVEKNGEAAWVSLGFFNRRDSEGKPVHPVANAIYMLPNHRARLDFLAGKTVVATKTEMYKRTIFENGQPVIDAATKKNAFDEKPTPILEFA